MRIEDIAHPLMKKIRYMDKVVDELAFGRDYAETCRRWRADFLARREEVLALGFDERFIRIWEFYLAYCEAGFDAGDIDVVQYTLAR